MEVALDYISVTLNDRFTWHDWLEYAEQPLVDETSGLVIGQRVPKKSYKLDIIYKHWVLSAYGKYTIELASLALHHDLEPTRLDIKIDIPESEVKNADTIQSELVQSVKQALRAKGSRRKHHYNATPQDNGIETRTDYFGARDSDSQIRIYQRRSQVDKNSLVRVEFQLRAELAKAAWSILVPAFFKPTRLMEVMASLENKVLLPGTFGIDWQSTRLYELDRSKDKVNSSRKDWIYNQVLPACLKEFEETGENLAEFLLEEVYKHLVEKQQKQIEWQGYKAKFLEKAQNALNPD